MTKAECPECGQPSNCTYSQEQDAFYYDCTACRHSWNERRADRCKCCTIRTVQEMVAIGEVSGGITLADAIAYYESEEAGK
jgi:hypothetical protein